MGIRISRKIGYFISEKKAKTVFVKQYRNILVDFIEGGLESKQQFLINLQEIIQEYSQKDRFDTNSIELNSFKTYLTEKFNSLDFFSFISSIYKYDNYHGILIRSPEMINCSRHDDLIDYYDYPDGRFKIKKLNRPIYPLSGFIYNGGLDKYGVENLEPGNTYFDHMISYSAKINHLVYKDKYDVNKNSLTLLRKENFFHPESHDYFFDLVKHIGLLKPDVTRNEFKLAMEPVTITSWG